MEYIEEAVRSQIWARVFLFAPTGGGKSRAAFELGSRLFGGGLPLTYINTEVDREKLYADRFKYGLIDMSRDEDFSPEAFVEALNLAEAKNPGGVIILDSITHEWHGQGGVLQLADRFGEWKTVRPRHSAFVDRLSRLNAHVIVCCRAKMKYEVAEEPRANGNGTRQVVKALGVGPQQDADLQYHFNLVGQLEVDTHDCSLSGHVDTLVDRVVNFGVDADEVAEAYTTWLAEGTPIEIPEVAGEEEVNGLVESLLAEGISQDKIDAGLATARKEARGVLTPAYVADQFGKSQKRLERKQAANEKKAELEASGQIGTAGGAVSDPPAANASGDAAAPPDTPEAVSGPQDAAGVEEQVPGQTALGDGA